MFNLSSLVGLNGAKARKFTHEISNLDSKITSGKSVSAKIMSEIYENSAEIVRLLGFSDYDVLAEEIFTALKNKFLGDEILVEKDDFWQKFKSSVVIAENGFVSANFEDVKKSLSKHDFRESDFENFQEEFRQKIIEKYHEKLPHFSKKNIKERLF